MSGFWMIGILLLWLLPGTVWLWERGVFSGLSRRTSNRKLVFLLPFFCLLLVYAQKPQNRPETPAAGKNKKQLTVAVVEKTLASKSSDSSKKSSANKKSTSSVAEPIVVSSVTSTGKTESIPLSIVTNTVVTGETERAVLATNTVSIGETETMTIVTNTAPADVDPTGTVQRTEASLTQDPMRAELKLSGVVPVSLTNSVWVDWTNGTEHAAWLSVPVRKAVAEIALPFEFPVGTNVFSNIYVSASGVIGFDRPRGSVVPEILPTEYGTNAVFLALIWGDNTFKPGLGSRLRYGPESNSFCVAMEQVFSGTNVFSAKAELFDNGNIVLKYRDLPADHTIGLQNRFGGWQVATNGTFEMFCRYFGWADPDKLDTDGDGLDDYDEIYIYGTDPRNPDTDRDGLSDSEEVALGYSPTAVDSNGDGLSDMLDSEGITVTSDPLSISRVLDGYAADDETYVPTPVISNNAVRVTTRLDLPEGVAPMGTMVEVAGVMVPILNGVTFSHSIALSPDVDHAICYAPSNLPEGSSVTIEIGAHRFAELEDPSGVVSRFSSISPEGDAPAGGSMFGLLTSPLPTPEPGPGTALVNLPVKRIEPEVVCVHGGSRKAELIMERRHAYDHFWSISPSGDTGVDGGYEVQVTPGFKRSETGTLSVRSLPRFRNAAGDYLRTVSAPVRFCPALDEEEKKPGDEQYIIEDSYVGWPTNDLAKAEGICPRHLCYYSMCPPEDFDHAHEGLPVATNFVQGALLQMDELKRYSTVAVSVPEPQTNCCPCPEHTGVYTWILPNWRLKAYDSPTLINETDRLERRDGYVYVTGAAPSKNPGDAHLVIAPKTGDVTVHEFTVFGLQLQPDYDGDGTISSGDLDKRKKGEVWKIEAGANRRHKIVFRTDVLLSFGIVKVSLLGTPEGCRITDAKLGDLCFPRQPWTGSLAGWRAAGEPAEKAVDLECQTPGSGEIVFEFMVVKDGKSYRCEKRQPFMAF